MGIESKFKGVLQGPMGSELRKRGIEERLSEASHQAHREVHDLYRQAGATILVADTFGATPLRRHESDKLSLQCTPTGKRFGPVYTRMNREMVAIARAAAGEEAVVAGSIAPVVDTSGKHDRSWRRLYSPERRGFLMDRQAPQMNALVDAGVDMVLGEAFRYVEEAKAVAALAEEFRVKALAICFEATVRGIPYREKKDPKNFRELKAELRTIAPSVEIFVGANCTGLSVIHSILASGDELDMVYANSLDFNGHQTEYGDYVAKKLRGLPEDAAEIAAIERRRGTSNDAFGQLACRAYEHGVKVVGACCGTTPDTTRVIRATWDDFQENQESGSMGVAL